MRWGGDPNPVCIRTPLVSPILLERLPEKADLGCHSSEPEAPLEPELPVSKTNHKESSFPLLLCPRTGSRVSSVVRSHQTPQSTNSSAACLPKQPVTDSRSASGRHDARSSQGPQQGAVMLATLSTTSFQPCLRWIPCHLQHSTPSCQDTFRTESQFNVLAL